MTCRRAAHHFADIARALREMKRVLKGNGRLVIDDRSAPDDDFIDATMNRLDRLHDESHVREHRPSEWQRMLSEAGFEVEAIERYTKHRPLSSLTASVSPGNAAEIHQIIASLGKLQRAAMNVVEKEGEIFTNHWYVMAVGVRRVCTQMLSVVIVLAKPRPRGWPPAGTRAGEPPDMFCVHTEARRVMREGRGNGILLLMNAHEREGKSIWRVLREGDALFNRRGEVYDALRRFVQWLDEEGIPYALIGGMALITHGYRRYTEDVDILLTAQGLAAFREKRVGRGYVPAFSGAQRSFRDTANNVRIEIITTGEYPGDGKPKPVTFPDPVQASIERDGIRVIRLERLIELKLASGLSAAHRLRDLADVQDLIAALDLPLDLADRLDASVRGEYRRLWEAARPADETGV
ncbi:MAG TPA: methyltransferase domain-containing protein [Anaerolineae bacterium]|nr:methyltransferase domain-containing protein [Anaerolineae bacterium]